MTLTLGGFSLSSGGPFDPQNRLVDDIDKQPVVWCVLGDVLVEILERYEDRTNVNRRLNRHAVSAEVAVGDERCHRRAVLLLSRLIAARVVVLVVDD